MLLNAGINPAQAIALSQNSLGTVLQFTFMFYDIYMYRTITSPSSTIASQQHFKSFFIRLNK